MKQVARLAVELESVKGDLVLLNLRVDSVLQSMKESNMSVDHMVTTLKRIMQTDSSPKILQQYDGDTI